MVPQLSLIYVGDNGNPNLHPFIVISNFKNTMCPRSFLCEGAKFKQRTSLKKELCENGKETIWESRFTSFYRDIKF